MLPSIFALLLLATPQPAEPAQPADDAAQQPAAEQAETKKICRYIRGGMGSRRKEKVCLTKEEWRAFNQGN